MKISKKYLQTFKSNAQTQLYKSIDRHIKLAVTGVSGSGKTAFITSLVNNLLNADSKQLPFFDVASEGRFLGAKIIRQEKLDVPSFPYDDAMASLSRVPPKWPSPTKGLSEVNLELRFQTEHPIYKRISSKNSLHLQIVDYPGEWLIDLPMLELDYFQWSKAMAQLFNSEPRKTVSDDFRHKLTSANFHERYEEGLLTLLSEEYTEILNRCKNERGLHLIQPGRFIQPGELENAPVLRFFPILDETTLHNVKKAYDDGTNASDEASLVQELNRRYEAYKEKVVKRFYKEEFKHFNRQVVLVDGLGALEKGQENFLDLNNALEEVLKNFQYGSNNIFKRILSPDIDKVLFAATKADHVTPEQHHNLLNLLESMTDSSKKQVKFEGVENKAMVLSAISATQYATAKHNGDVIPCVKGKHKHTQNDVTLFPGEVPTNTPHESQWQAGFHFYQFEPVRHDKASLPHIRLDHAIQYLLGDKMI